MSRALLLGGPDVGHSMTTDDFNISLTRDVRGVTALQHLRDPSRVAADADELLIQASVVQHADAYTGAAIRALIESHLNAGPGRGTCIWLPKGAAANRVADLVGPLPDRCTIPDDTPKPLRDKSVIVPGSVITSMEGAELMALFLRAAAPHASVRADVARLLAQALLAFADNGLRYATDSGCGVVVCCALDRETKRASVVCIDQGQSVCTARDPLSRIRASLSASALNFGGLTSIRQLADGAGLEAMLTISSGSARVRRPGETRAGTAYVPGWAAALTVSNRAPVQESGSRQRRNG